MIFPIILGYKNTNNQDKYIGNKQCPNCKKYAPFYACKNKKQLSIYFIPIVNFNKDRFVICGYCGQKYTIS